MKKSDYRLLDWHGVSNGYYAKITAENGRTLEFFIIIEKKSVYLTIRDISTNRKWKFNPKTPQEAKRMAKDFYINTYPTIIEDEMEYIESVDDDDCI